jgi:hypothetical protein
MLQNKKEDISVFRLSTETFTDTRNVFLVRLHEILFHLNKLLFRL